MKAGVVGDERLLRMKMSEAAEYYEVPASVIPARIRKVPLEPVYA